MSKQVEEKVNNFFSKHRPTSFTKGEIIISPDTEIDYIYLLKKGMIRMYIVSEDGEEITLHIFRPGAYLPIMLPLSHNENKYYFEAVNAVETIKAPTRDVIEFLKEETDVLFNLTTRFAEAICGFLIRIESTTFEDAYRKIANLFIYLADRFGEEENGHTIIKLPLGHKDIANWIGIRRETVSRQFEKMQKEGIVASNNKQLIIIDLEKLKLAGSVV